MGVYSSEKVKEDTDALWWTRVGLAQFSLVFNNKDTAAADTVNTDFIYHNGAGEQLYWGGCCWSGMLLMMSESPVEKRTKRQLTFEYLVLIYKQSQHYWGKVPLQRCKIFE